MSFDPRWSFANYNETFQSSQTGTPYQTLTGSSPAFQVGPLFPLQADPHQLFLTGPPPLYQTGHPHLLPSGPPNHFQICPPHLVLSEAPHPPQIGPPYLFQPQPQPLHPFQTQVPPFYQTATHSVFLTGPVHHLQTQDSQASFTNNYPLQRVTHTTYPSTPPSQLLIMESAESSPEKQTPQQTHADLLQAFQSFKPARRGPSKTPQPPSISRAQRSSTPATNAGQAIRAGMTAFQLDSPSPAASTQETATTTTRKRPRQSTHVEQNEEQESSDSDTPLTQAPKRPRQIVSKPSDKPADMSTTKKACTVPQHVVEVQIQNGLARLEKVASRTLQHINSSIQGEQGRASMTPEVAAISIKEPLGQQTHQHQSTATIFAPQTAQSSKAFASQLLNENQNFAQSLTQKNGTFLRSIPPTATSYLEAKLAEVTAESTRQHQEKVDAIRLEYVAELQRDMDERQRVIDMLLKK